MVPKKGANGAVCSIGNIWCRTREHKVPNKGAYGAVFSDWATTQNIPDCLGDNERVKNQ